MKYIKPYSGPSRTWFANQDSLCEGCCRLSAIVSDLPVNTQTAEVLVKLLLRLDKKLQVGGVDDSNGTVSGFMGEAVQMLMEYTRIDPACIETFELLTGKQTCFGWEEPLVRILALPPKKWTQRRGTRIFLLNDIVLAFRHIV